MTATDTIDRLFQRHLADAKRTVERLSRKPHGTTTSPQLWSREERADVGD
ncbi:hypothetical protein [Rhodovibrio sodomensis]|nr:hypothetical protein [Rhodovibrio sodomensis]